jgi:hypothetical protein
MSQTGKIWGRDSIMSYDGSCETDGDRFSAIVTLKLHTRGHATVFGADDLTLRLEGTCPGKIATYVGTAEQVPGVLLEGTLIFSEQQPPAPQPSAPIPTFDLTNSRSCRGAPADAPSIVAPSTVMPANLRMTLTNR